MKYALMSYSLARQHYTPGQIVDTAARLEFDGIDWVSTYGENPDTLQRRCADAGLPVVAYTFFAERFQAQRAGWQDEIRRELETAVRLGAPLAMLPTPALARTADRDECRHLWNKALAVFVAAARDAGVVPTVENYPGRSSPLVTADDFLEIRRQNPALFLTFDNGNAAGGENPVESCRRCLPWIRHVHLKDWIRFDTDGPDRTPMPDGKFYRSALVGEGDIDPVPIIRLLDEAGYTGYANIEYESDDIPAPEAMRRALAFLRMHTGHPAGTGTPQIAGTRTIPRADFTL